MKGFLLAGIILIPAFCFGQFIPGNDVAGIRFVENQGQVKDESGAKSNWVQFCAHDNGLRIFIGEGKVLYRFCHFIRQKADIAHAGRNGTYSWRGRTSRIPAMKMEACRLEWSLVGANLDAPVTANEPDSYYETHYASGSQGSIETSHSFRSVTYKNVYPGIDWVIRTKGSGMEYDFEIGPGGDASKIKIRYDGSTSLVRNTDGSVTASTPLGYIREHAPVCYVKQPDGSRKILPSTFRLNHKVLQFDVTGSKSNLVVDPSVEWGTYYGPDSNLTQFFGVTTDRSGHVYACGFTYSAAMDIATTGSFQSAPGSVLGNGFLAKFDSSGHRLWATYYGASGYTYLNSVSCDLNGNVYAGGRTSSGDSMTTTGSYQPALGGPTATNGILVKFNPAGVRMWATYYGGNLDDEIYSVSCDSSTHVYIAGLATSTVGIASPGAFETIFHNPLAENTAGFLAQFDTTGNFYWGTYYVGYCCSGTTIDLVNVVACTDGNSIYLAGQTGATDSLTTAGTWQPDFGTGLVHNFMVKFTASGARLWATYYGGNNIDNIGGITCDHNGAIYLLGTTNSDTGIVSSGCSQPLRSGGFDAFLVKFDPELGMRQWGTYFGGPGIEYDPFCNLAVDDSNNVFITGYTTSRTGIASPGVFQSTFGGGTEDAFVAKFTSSGVKEWSSYYGGVGNDIGGGCAYDGANLYVCGQTTSTNHIATTGAFESTGGSADTLFCQGFLVKIRPLSGPLGLPLVPAGNNLKLWPSPNYGNFYISASCPGAGATGTIVISDMVGREVLRQAAQFVDGSVQVQINAAKLLAPGDYVLALLGNGVARSVKFTVTGH